jgi:class 3 adenylate cyclase
VPRSSSAASDSPSEIERHLRRETNAALRAGAFWAGLFGLSSSLMLPILTVFARIDGLILPNLLSVVATILCAVLYGLARQERVHGRVAYAILLPLVLLPTVFFVATELLMPAGAATFITGPISYLAFFVVVLTGFLFEFRFSAVAGVIAAAGYFASFLLARRGLAPISGPDATVIQDLQAAPIYAVKCVLLVFTGLLTGALAAATRRLVFKVRSEERERASLDRLFGEYVSPEVKEKLLRDPTAQRGERKHVVILFSDIRGFTAWSEKSDPARIVERLNAYFDQMVDAIQAHGGVIDKFIGDAIMATFGGVLALETPSASAVAAARTMRVRLAELNRQWGEAGEPKLDNGIGLHHGEVIQGAIGSRDRKNYTVIGDSVNIAARLEGLTRSHPHAILISAEVRAQLPHELQEICSRLGQVKVKGREAEVEVFGVSD